MRLALLALLCAGLLWTSSSSAAPFPSSSPFTASTTTTAGCDVCVLLLTVLESENSTTVAKDISRGLDDLCKGAFGKEHPELLKDCELVSKAFAAQLPQFAHTLNGSLYTARTLCDIASLCTVDCCAKPSDPEQVRLVLTSDPSKLVVSFVALARFDSPAVSSQCGATSLHTSPATRHTYEKGGWRGNIYTAVLENIVGGEQCWFTIEDRATKQTFPRTHFTAVNRRASAHPATAPLRMLSLGDMGTTHSQETYDGITDLMKARGFDMVVHNGDISYADGIQQLWDEYCRKMEPISAHVPYMTTPGNHELPWDFAAYRARFAEALAVGDSDEPRGNNTPAGMFWSRDVGPVHLVGIDTEDEADMPVVYPDQLEWIRNDLKRANEPSARKLRPWIVVLGHRPLYCSGKGGFVGHDCGVLAQYLRDKLEDIYVENGVDLVLQAHKHQVEPSFSGGVDFFLCCTADFVLLFSPIVRAHLPGLQVCRPISQLQLHQVPYVRDKRRRRVAGRNEPLLCGTAGLVGKANPALWLWRSAGFLRVRAQGAKMHEFDAPVELLPGPPRCHSGREEIARALR
jgi:3',5'-cyclic AMP phosphodiesterase CpdA